MARRRQFSPARGNGSAAVGCVVVTLGLLLFAPLAQAADPPQIGSAWTSSVNAVSAALHAEVNPSGASATYHFSYLSEAAYEANLAAGREGFAGAAKAPAGTDPSITGSVIVDVSQTVASLSAETSYRYRVQATNAAGTEVGASHAFTTQGFGGGATLLDGRGWELVSPVEKNGGQVQGFGANFGGDVLQAAVGGGAVTYSSASSFGEAAQGAPAASQYLARRDAGGWSTQNITTPTVSGAYGAEPEGVPYQLFSDDLARGLVLNGRRCRGEEGACPVANPPLAGTEAPAGYGDYYLRDDESGGFQALLTDADVGGFLALAPEDFELGFAGASPDLRHLILSTCAALSAEATEVPGAAGCDSAEPNLYEYSEGRLQLVNLLPGQTQGTPGAALASQSLAVSAGGSRVYWTQGGDLYLREGAQSEQVDEALGGGGEFQTASADGSIAFLTKGGHLYRYEAAAHTLTDLTPGGGVRGVLGASEDGSHLYYETSAGLFLWHEGTTTEVASGAEAAAPGDYPPTTGTARVTPDGTQLAFLSKASLTGFDNADRSTGQPDTEVYLYDATSGELTCASCNPSGERPRGDSTIPGAIANGEGPAATDSYKPRDLSANGRRLFFDSAESLVLQDTNNALDVYEWEAQGEGTCARTGGCIGLLSSGRSAEGASFVDASATGSDAFFLTDGSLVAADPGSVDLYDAREGGGFPEAAKPIECEGDACQPLPSEPEDPTPGTLVPNSGNPPVHFAKSPAKPSPCKKGFVKRHGKCVRKARGRKKKSRRRSPRRAGRHHRGRR